MTSKVIKLNQLARLTTSSVAASFDRPLINFVTYSCKSGSCSERAFSEKACVKPRRSRGWSDLLAIVRDVAPRREEIDPTWTGSFSMAICPFLWP